MFYYHRRLTWKTLNQLDNSILYFPYLPCLFHSFMRVYWLVQNRLHESKMAFRKMTAIYSYFYELQNWPMCLSYGCSLNGMLVGEKIYKVNRAGMSFEFTWQGDYFQFSRMHYLYPSWLILGLRREFWSSIIISYVICIPSSDLTCRCSLVFLIACLTWLSQLNL